MLVYTTCLEALAEGVVHVVHAHLLAQRELGQADVVRVVHEVVDVVEAGLVGARVLGVVGWAAKRRRALGRGVGNDIAVAVAPPGDRRALEGMEESEPMASLVYTVSSVSTSILDSEKGHTHAVRPSS